MRLAPLILVLSLRLHPGGLLAVPPADAFEAGTFTASGGTILSYRIHLPNDLKPGEKIPLVLFFHGAGERGGDNVSQMVHAIPALSDFMARHQTRAIVIAPQCPLGQQWVDVPWGDDSHIMPEEPSVSMKAVVELLQQSIRDLPVDGKRIYATGISMGGFGTWDLISRHPELFAAAIPVCGGGDLAQASRLKNLPVWAFHGAEDTVVKTSRSREMIAAIRNAGGNPSYTEYPKVWHDSWSRTYSDDAVLTWLFEQKKP